jgi:hypothetical protein
VCPSSSEAQQQQARTLGSVFRFLDRQSAQQATSNWHQNDDMYESNSFNSFLGFGDQLFAGILLLVTAGISAHIVYGYGTKRAKELFVGLVLLTMACVQLYHLVNAAIYMPATRFYTYNVS